MEHTHEAIVHIQPRKVSPYPVTWSSVNHASPKRSYRSLLAADESCIAALHSDADAVRRANEPSSLLDGNDNFLEVAPRRLAESV
eukprot:1157228-Pleurochrysis_carterae.AAC.1